MRDERHVNGRKLEFGVLLPHFSNECTQDRLLNFSERIEELGFNSVWVRDNLSFEGHGFENPGKFVDPFITLSTVAGMTDRLKLGTAVAVPFRHPLVTAQLAGSLSWVSRGRFELGIGPGTPRKPFELTGTRYDDRIILCRETAEVMRCVSHGPHASYRGRITSFDDATIDPPPPPDLFIWYGGGSTASIRRAVDYGDGILPGLCPFRSWDVMATSARALAAERGKNLRFGSIPLISIGPSYEHALAKAQPAVKPLANFLQSYYKMPFENVQDLAGAMIIGTSEDVKEQIGQFAGHGAHLVIFDARLLMGEFEDVIEEIGQEVLPAFTSGTT